MTGRMLGAAAALVVAATVVVTAQGRATQGTATIVLNPPPATAAAVTFSATYPKQMEKYDISVQVVCYQDKKIVYAESRPWQQSFLLGGFASEWATVGGVADCVADLYYWTFGGGQKFHWLASTDFLAMPKS